MTPDSVSSRSACAPEAEPLLVIWKAGLDTLDGSSVQLRRLLAEPGRRLAQVCWEMTQGEILVAGNWSKQTLALSPPYRWRRGAGFVMRQWARWAWPMLLRRCRRAHAASGLLPRVAYVVVYGEEHAKVAELTLKTYGIRTYVVHVMDLMADQGGRGLRGGAFQRLLNGAAVVAAVNDRIADELRDMDRDRVQVIPLAAGHEPRLASWRKERRTTLLMGGAIYAEDPAQLEFLLKVVEPAWRVFAAETPGASWCYYGAAYDRLPSSVKSLVENLGRLSEEELVDELGSTVAALLPVSHPAEGRWRFSVPSRLCDYLAAGLPCIVPPVVENATGDLIRRHPGGAFLSPGSREACLAGLRLLHGEEAEWQRRSKSAMKVGNHFSPSAARQRVAGILAPLHKE